MGTRMLSARWGIGAGAGNDGPTLADRGPLGLGRLPLASLLLGFGLLLAQLLLAAPASAAPADAGIAFVSDRDGDQEIWAMTPTGSDPTKLTDDPGQDAWPNWSPDGARVAFASDRDNDGENPEGDLEIFTMLADGSNVTQLTDNAARDDDPTWSPDGSQIAFISRRDGNEEIYTMLAATGSLQTNRTNNPASDVTPNWSPDGSRIAFGSDRSGNNYNVYTMTATGAAQTRITDDPGTDAWPAWSPDGARIAFTSLRSGGGDIYSMLASGSAQTRLTTNGAEDTYASWSPDGARIAFASFRDFNWELYTMNPDGSSQTRVTNDPAADTLPDWSLAPLPGPGTFSDDCDATSTPIADGFAGDTYVRVRVAEPPAPNEDETWVCVQAANATANVGGKFVVESGSVPGVPNVQDDHGRCSTEPGNQVPGPHPIDAELGDPANPPYALVELDSYTDGDQAWVCVHAAETGTDTEFGKRVVIPFPSTGSVGGVRFEPDATPAEVPDPIRTPFAASGYCHDHKNDGTYEQLVNTDVDGEHLWLDVLAEGTTKAHVCVREDGTANMGGRFTLDTQGFGAAPVIETSDTDMTPCTAQVFKSDALEVEIRRSGDVNNPASFNPASVCVRHGTTQKRVTVGTSGSPALGLVTWTPDFGTPIPPIP